MMGHDPDIDGLRGDSGYYSSRRQVHRVGLDVQRLKTFLLHDCKSKRAISPVKLEVSIIQAPPRISICSLVADCSETSIPCGTLLNSIGTLTIRTVVAAARNEMLQTKAASPAAANLMRRSDVRSRSDLLARLVLAGVSREERISSSSAASRTGRLSRARITRTSPRCSDTTNTMASDRSARPIAARWRVPNMSAHPAAGSAAGPHWP